jgi:hypothetical protein
VLDAVALIMGAGLTVTRTVPVPAQPEVLPVTVYIVVEEGNTVTGEPGIEPGFHT